MNTSNTFHLIGNESTLPDWVVKLKQRPDLNYIFNQNEDLVITASPWPLLKSDQLPQDWLLKDPGFPILLRNFSVATADNRPWIFLPFIAGVTFQRLYLLRTAPKKSIKKTLVILRSSQAHLVELFLKRYPQREVRFIFLDRPYNYVPESALEFKKELYFYQSHWRPDSVLSPAFDEVDTYTPYHLHSLHLGAFLEDMACEEVTKPIASRKCWYGDWELFSGSALPS